MILPPFATQGDVQMFRGLTKTQVLGDGVEVADVTQFHGDAFYTSFFAKNQEAPTGKTHLLARYSEEGAALLLVDDFDAPPLRGGQCFRPAPPTAELDYVTSSRGVSDAGQKLCWFAFRLTFLIRCECTAGLSCDPMRVNEIRASSTHLRRLK